MLILFSLAANENYYYLKFEQNTILLAAILAVCSLFIIFGIRDLSHNKEIISRNSKLKNSGIILNISAFLIMGIGIILESFYTAETSTGASHSVYYLHQYSIQAIMFTGGGTVILVISYLVYYTFISKQVLEELDNEALQN